MREQPLRSDEGRPKRRSLREHHTRSLSPSIFPLHLPVPPLCLNLSPLTSSRSQIHSEGQVMLCLWRSLFPVLFIWCIMYKGPGVCFTPSLALLNHFSSYLCFSILTQGLIRWGWCWAFKRISLLLGLRFFTMCSTPETRPCTLMCTARSLRKCGHIDFKSKSGVQAKDQWIVP